MKSGLVPACLAAAIAASCAPAHDVKTLYADLQSNDPEVRQDAQETIEKITREGDYKVFLRGALSDVKVYQGPSIVYLAHMPQPEARAALRDLLRIEQRSLIPFNPIRLKTTEEESDSRILVAHLISENGGDPLAVETLTAGVDGQPAEVVAATCYALGALGDPRGVPFLAQAAGHPDVEVVRASVQALGTLHSGEALAALRPVVHHPSAEVRAEVLSALQLHTEPGTLEMIETIAASDPSPELRVSAISQMSRFRDPASVPFLIERLNDKDPNARQAALDSLRLLSGRVFGPRPQEWARWWAQSPQLPPARP